MDFRYEHYNAAHPDSQVKGYLVGNESVTLINLCPDRVHASFHLPGVSPEISIELKQSAKPPRERTLPAKLDTLCFLPEEGKFYQVWRGYFQPDNETAVTKIYIRG